jgi:NADH dehydrogenase (ubiquinone) Fe-S protein 6
VRGHVVFAYLFSIRLARFAHSEKLVNPNIAAHLIAEVPPQACEEHVIHCDGGHAALGHPRVYINLVGFRIY